jgi:hypothetical protein
MIADTIIRVADGAGSLSPARDTLLRESVDPLGQTEI